MGALSKSIRTGARFLAAPYYVVTGIEKNANTRMDIVWSGPNEHLAYLIKRIFEPESSEIKYVGRHMLPRLDSLLARFGCDIAMVIAPHIVVSRIALTHDISLPLWVDTSVELNDKQPLPQTRDIKRSLKRFADNGCTWKMSSSPTDVRYFFDSIYLPTIHSSHGDSALPASLDDRLTIVKNGRAELMQVFQKDQCIAGLIIDFRNQVPALREIGVLNGSHELKQQGIIPSLNYYAFEHLRLKGFGVVSLGLSRPFLDDGVLQFKRKFRPEISATADECLLFRIRKKTASVRSMLCASPCFAYHKNRLARTFFQDTEFGTTFAEDDKSYLDWDFGVPAIRVVDLSNMPLADNKLNTSLVKRA